MLELDHECCRSIYAIDPNGIIVELCCTTRAFTPEETAWAVANIAAPAPELETVAPPATVHEPLVAAP